MDYNIKSYELIRLLNDYLARKYSYCIKGFYSYPFLVNQVCKYHRRDLPDDLIKTKNIRNKIAHFRSVTEEEFFTPRNNSSVNGH